MFGLRLIDIIVRSIGRRAEQQNNCQTDDPCVNYTELGRCGIVMFSVSQVKTTRCYSGPVQYNSRKDCPPGSSGWPRRVTGGPCPGPPSI